MRKIARNRQHVYRLIALLGASGAVSQLSQKQEKRTKKETEADINALLPQDDSFLQKRTGFLPSEESRGELLGLVGGSNVLPPIDIPLFSGNRHPAADENLFAFVDGAFRTFFESVEVQELVALESADPEIVLAALKGLREPGIVLFHQLNQRIGCLETVEKLFAELPPERKEDFHLKTTVSLDDPKWEVLFNRIGRLLMSTSQKNLEAWHELGHLEIDERFTHLSLQAQLGFLVLLFVFTGDLPQPHPDVMEAILGRVYFDARVFEMESRQRWWNQTQKGRAEQQVLRSGQKKPETSSVRSQQSFSEEERRELLERDQSICDSFAEVRARANRSLKW